MTESERQRSKEVNSQTVCNALSLDFNSSDRHKSYHLLMCLCLSLEFFSPNDLLGCLVLLILHWPDTSTYLLSVLINPRLCQCITPMWKGFNFFLSDASFTGTKFWSNTCWWLLLKRLSIITPTTTFLEKKTSNGNASILAERSWLMAHLII